MNLLGPKSMAKPITLQSVRDWILDEKLTANDSLLLHPDDFDGLVLEYRELYGNPMPNHYLVLEVLVDESTRIPVPKGRVVVVKDDDRPGRLDSLPTALPRFDDDRIIYRCTYCGNVINSGGGLLDFEERKVLIDWLQARRSNENVRGVAGICCKGGRSN